MINGKQNEGINNSGINKNNNKDSSDPKSLRRIAEELSGQVSPNSMSDEDAQVTVEVVQPGNLIAPPIPTAATNPQTISNSQGSIMTDQISADSEMTPVIDDQQPRKFPGIISLKDRRFEQKEKDTFINRNYEPTTNTSEITKSLDKTHHDTARFLKDNGLLKPSWEFTKPTSIYFDETLQKGGKETQKFLLQANYNVSVHGKADSDLGPSFNKGADKLIKEQATKINELVAFTDYAGKGRSGTTLASQADKKVEGVRRDLGISKSSDHPDHIRNNHLLDDEKLAFIDAVSMAAGPAHVNRIKGMHKDNKYGIRSGEPKGINNGDWTNDKLDSFEKSTHTDRQKITEEFGVSLSNENYARAASKLHDIRSHNLRSIATNNLGREENSVNYKRDKPSWEKDVEKTQIDITSVKDSIKSGNLTQLGNGIRDAQGDINNQLNDMVGLGKSRERIANYLSKHSETISELQSSDRLEDGDQQKGWEARLGKEIMSMGSKSGNWNEKLKDYGEIGRKGHALAENFSKLKQKTIGVAVLPQTKENQSAVSELFGERAATAILELQSNIPARVRTGDDRVKAAEGLAELAGYGPAARTLVKKNPGKWAELEFNDTMVKNAKDKLGDQFFSRVDMTNTADSMGKVFSGMANESSTRNAPLLAEARNEKAQSNKFKTFETDNKNANDYAAVPGTQAQQLASREALSNQDKENQNVANLNSANNKYAYGERYSQTSSDRSLLSNVTSNSSAAERRYDDRQRERVPTR
ncbi:hypothetical protein [uncultured Roseibium sp.]|uniref:hypothetical protein n=1 Tax=uncultured Roseibium sp. TaxID=1936171 RepID=UPI00262382FD|nr:hypothetical protein [uncultured Roseibium sp.]